MVGIRFCIDCYQSKKTDMHFVLTGSSHPILHLPIFFFLQGRYLFILNTFKPYLPITKYKLKKEPYLLTHFIEKIFCLRVPESLILLASRAF